MMQPVASHDAESQTDLARRIAALSIERWGPQMNTVLVGRHPLLVEAQERLAKFAQADSPVLITGETGTGKELFARSLFLLCARHRRPFLSINCAQFQDSHLLVSELFGHKKGSFTGAATDRLGLFEEADGGVVFLDEIGDLPATAQAMLLRTLSEGEIVRIGESRPRRVNVRVIAATARSLDHMIAAGAFRQDLYFRLRFLRLRIPTLRERGDDWRLAAGYYLHRLNASHSTGKQFSRPSCEILQSYSWPGNVRELKGVVELGFFQSQGDAIAPEHFASELTRDGDSEDESPGERDASPPSPTAPADPYERMRSQDATFWTVVHKPFMNRELNRREVRDLVARGLHDTQGSYKRLLPVFGIPPSEYLRFMDFLRHHDLKPR